MNLTAHLQSDLNASSLRGKIFKIKSYWSEESERATELEIPCLPSSLVNRPGSLLHVLLVSLKKKGESYEGMVTTDLFVPRKKEF